MGTPVMITLKTFSFRSSLCGAVTKSDCNGLGRCGDDGSIPGLGQWVKGSGTAAAVAWIQSLAQDCWCSHKKKKKAKHFTLGFSVEFFSKKQNPSKKKKKTEIETEESLTNLEESI